MLRDIFFKTGPTSFLVEMLRILSSCLLVLLVVFVLGGSHYWIALAIVVGLTLGVVSKYVWWHFRPPKPPTQPWNRYTKH